MAADNAHKGRQKRSLTNR